MSKIIKSTIAILTLSIGITSCNVTYDNKSTEERVKTITVVDVQTGDTIQITLPGNPGIASSAKKISK